MDLNICLKLIVCCIFIFLFGLSEVDLLKLESKLNDTNKDSAAEQMLNEVNYENDVTKIIENHPNNSIATNYTTQNDEALRDKPNLNHSRNSTKIGNEEPPTNVSSAMNNAKIKKGQKTSIVMSTTSTKAIHYKESTERTKNTKSSLSNKKITQQPTKNKNIQRSTLSTSVFNKSSKKITQQPTKNKNIQRSTLSTIKAEVNKPLTTKETTKKTTSSSIKHDSVPKTESTILKPLDAQSKSDNGSNHFFIFLCFGLLFIIIAYIVFQKRKKILGFLIEGRNTARKPRQSGTYVSKVRYVSLKSDDKEEGKVNLKYDD